MFSDTMGRIWSVWGGATHDEQKVLFTLAGLISIVPNKTCGVVEIVERGLRGFDLDQEVCPVSQLVLA